MTQDHSQVFVIPEGRYTIRTVVNNDEMYTELENEKTGEIIKLPSSPSKEWLSEIQDSSC
mgnify:CR=1 FL=1